MLQVQGTCGHIQKECPNLRAILITENGEYESASDVEEEADDDGLTGEEHTYCDFEQGASLVVTQVLSVQPRALEDDQRHNLFQTRA
jgi:hypothetical protein